MLCLMNFSGSFVFFKVIQVCTLVLRSFSPNRMSSCKLTDVLYLIWYPNLSWALCDAWHLGTFLAPSDAVFDSHGKFSKRPVVFSKKIILILPKKCVNFCAIGAIASLAAVTGNWRIVFLQMRQYLFKRKKLL